MIQEENRSNVKWPRTCYMRFTDDYLDAAEVHFEVNPENSQQYSLWMGTDDNKQYLKIVEKEETRGNLELSATPYYFTIEKRADTGIYRELLHILEKRQNKTLTVTQHMDFVHTPAIVTRDFLWNSALKKPS